MLQATFRVGELETSPVKITRNNEVDEEDNPATWGAHVTDEEYGGASPIDG
jgi:hypothetical protein